MKNGSWWQANLYVIDRSYSSEWSCPIQSDPARSWVHTDPSRGLCITTTRAVFTRPLCHKDRDIYLFTLTLKATLIPTLTLNLALILNLTLILILGCVTGCIYHRSVAVLRITGQMRHRAINIFTLTPELGVLPCVTWPMLQRAYESHVCSGSMCNWAFCHSLCVAGPLFQD